jgi:hypothetical protein
MILLSKSLGRLFMAGVPETGPPGPDAQQMLMVGTALIGLFYLASAASDVFDAAGIWVAPILMPETFALDEAGATIELVRAAGTVALGGLLLWLARSLFGRKA